MKTHNEESPRESAMAVGGLTYPERAGKMSKSARKAACAEAGRAWTKAQHAAGNIGELEILVVNQLRAAGENLNRAAGREQLLFNINGLEFCRKELLPLLPAGMGIEQLQACVHIANNVKQPIKTREELRAVKQELQMAFVALGLTAAPRRLELQSAHARNLFSDFVNRAAGMKLLFDELETEEPPERWSPAKQDEFLETTQPVAAMIEKVKLLRLGKKV